MAPLPISTCTALRTCARQRLPALTASSVAVQQRGRADARPAAFDSPFSKVDVNKIPSFGGYKSNRGEISNKMFQYFMAGSFGALAAAGAKSTVQGASESSGNGEQLCRGGTFIDTRLLTYCPVDFLVNMSASADVLAQAKVEIELAQVAEGKNVCCKASWKCQTIADTT